MWFEYACRCSELRYQLFRKEEDNADLQRALSACEDTVAALTAKLEEVRSGTVGDRVFGFIESGSGSNILGRIPIRIRIQGFDDQKLKKITAEKNLIFFWSKLAIYVPLGLHKGRPSYRRCIQSQRKRTSSISKQEISWLFLLCG
jgi:hypothetical protein